MTPVGETDVEIILRVAVRGRMSDLAEIVAVSSRAGTVVMLFLDSSTEPGEQTRGDVTAAAGGGSA